MDCNRRFLNIRIVLLAYSILSAWAHSEQPNVANSIPEITSPIKNIVSAAKQGSEDLVRKGITDEYNTAVRGLEKMLKRKLTVVHDFDFYALIVEKIVVLDQVAYVQGSVVFNPLFLASPRAIQALNGMGAPSWSSTGGFGLAGQFEKDGTGTVTYFLVKQHGFWKIHYSYFSYKPLPASALTYVAGQMKTLVHPN